MSALFATLMSSESGRFVILDSPSARCAKNSARIACDFEPGIVTVPLRVEFWTTSFMAKENLVFGEAFIYTKGSLASCEEEKAARCVWVIHH